MERGHLSVKELIAYKTVKLPSILLKNIVLCENDLWHETKANRAQEHVQDGC